MPSDSRLIKIADDAAELPEDLLLAQSRGEVLFLAGAGVSRGAPACLPNFKNLARQLYEELDASVCPYLDDKRLSPNDLTPPQRAEVDRYHRNELDVALGLLERRLDGPEATETSRVREAVQQHLSAKTPTPLHWALSRLADRGDATAILTTNFDLLFERCTRRRNHPVPTYGLGGMPRPSKRTDFSGIFHIHGVLPARTGISTDLVLTDLDFGEYYFRRRFIPDFLYDASRIYQLVLVGYSVNDPPMQYLLNAIAADTSRFHDIRRPYIFVSDGDEKRLSDLKGRGLIPITYQSANDHFELTRTMERWTDFASRVTSQRIARRIVRLAVQNSARTAPLADVRLVSHLIKYRSSNEIRDLAKIAGRSAHLSWLTTMLDALEKRSQTGTPVRRTAHEVVTQEFLRTRLRRVETLQWVLQRGRSEIAEAAIRRSVSALLDKADRLPARWRLAWQWIQESWSSTARNTPTTRQRTIDRIRVGERSGMLIHEVADIVQPPLLVDVQDVLTSNDPSASLFVRFGEADFVDLDGKWTSAPRDRDFLRHLAHELAGRLNRALDTMRRVHGRRADGVGIFGTIQFSDPKSSISALRGEAHDPNSGLGPLVQLLYATLLNLSILDPRSAKPILQSLRWDTTAIARRLWAAIAAESDQVTGDEVGDFLREIGMREFWDFRTCPEFANLRAKRYGDLTDTQQRAVAARLRRGPPRFSWLRHLDTVRLADYRKRCTLRAFQDITDSGGSLAKRDEEWRARFEHREPYSDSPDFLREPMTQVHWGREPDPRFDDLLESELANALETSLVLERVERHLAGYGAAGAWVEMAENWPRVIDGLEAQPRGGADFPHLWDCFGAAHYPGTPNTTITAERRAQGERVLALLSKRPIESVGHDIAGIGVWFDHWKHLVTSTVSGLLTALRFWSLACRATEESLPSKGLDWILDDQRHQHCSITERFESSVLNTHAGRIAGVLVSGLTGAGTDDEGIGARILDVLGKTPGRSGMIAKYFLARQLWHLWFEHRAWTERNLVAPMLDGDEKDLTLWMAFARVSSSQAVKEVVETLGDAMVEKTLDGLLDVRTRATLAILLMRYFLSCFWNECEEKVSLDKMRQSLRQSETDILADVVHRSLLDFLEHGPTPEASTSEADARAERFRRAVKLVLRDVWPMERTPDRPDLTEAMARIPVASGPAFSDGVDAVQRFLYPFNVGSVQDYGFGEHPEALGEVVKSERDARALLNLLDRTVGEGDEARMPFDGDEALARIRTVAPRLAKEPTFRRLEILQKRSIFE